jgi:uncharacterized HAD superfamily protein
MARRLKIGVDVDGVLVDFVAAFKKEAAQVLGREIIGEQTSWDFEDSLEISQSEVSKVWDSIDATPDWFYLNAIAKPGVEHYLPWLTRAHDVYFITSRKQGAGLPVAYQTQLCLYELGVEFPVVIANTDKGETAAALELDAFVDDYIKNIERVCKVSPKTRVYIMDATYNKDFEGPFTRVTCFEDFANKIEDLSNE